MLKSASNPFLSFSFAPFLLTCSLVHSRRIFVLPVYFFPNVRFFPLVIGLYVFPSAAASCLYPLVFPSLLFPSLLSLLGTLYLISLFPDPVNFLPAFNIPLVFLVFSVACGPVYLQHFFPLCSRVPFFFPSSSKFPPFPPLLWVRVLFFSSQCPRSTQYPLRLSFPAF